MSTTTAPARRGQCQTVHDVIEMYLAQAKRDLTARSYETVSCILNRFDESAGELALAECRPFDLQCWLNEHPEYASEWYRRCVVSTIKRCVHLGSRNGTRGTKSVRQDAGQPWPGPAPAAHDRPGIPDAPARVQCGLPAFPDLPEVHRLPAWGSSQHALGGRAV